MLNDMKPSIKCSKCGNPIDEEYYLKESKNLLCPDCKKKHKRRVFAVVLSVLCCVALLVGGAALFLIPKKGFSGVQEIDDSIVVQDIPFDISKVTPVSSPDTETTIDDIESFRSAFAKNTECAERNGENVIVIPSIDVLFSFNDATVDLRYSDLVAEFCKAFRSTNSKGKILVKGYTCDIGSFMFNDSLSKRRALSVREQLMKNGISEDLIVVQWFGKSKFSEFNYPSKSLYRRTVIGIE